jgi:hypothetical protein
MTVHLKEIFWEVKGLKQSHDPKKSVQQASLKVLFIEMDLAESGLI